ncbi:(2Fe-2S)-binding protein [Microbulbifer litoralis]|uniref:(2Fe-2S)-binding protein n=1 Tax=Microbulbifer litoralis TaxID=2933965 RepID=UPI002028AF31|nr:2Fe-2S iron-sulfur cluster-binding protein [Microbulbifer sp. GX H0434]
MAGLSVSMEINGRAVGPMEVPEYTSMLDFLQEYLNLTGTKLGCGIGVCRACEVIVEGDDGELRTLRTCINNVGRFNGKKITTVEGHAQRNADGDIESLSPVQEAFLRHFSFQCGWCTPGFVNAATVLIEQLKKSPVAKDEVEATIDGALGKHICRCTGYVRYFHAVRDVIESTPGLLKEGD